MGSSLVKFATQSRESQAQKQVFWGRVEQDGLPFRGAAAPTYTNEEFEDRVARVADPKNGTFCTWKPDENKVYLDVLDKIMNGWAVCYFTDRWRDEESGNYKVYIEWAEYYLEDGSRSPGSYGQAMEMSHGQTNGPSNP